MTASMQRLVACGRKLTEALLAAHPSGRLPTMDASHSAAIAPEVIAPAAANATSVEPGVARHALPTGSAPLVAPSRALLAANPSGWLPTLDACQSAGIAPEVVAPAAANAMSLEPGFARHAHPTGAGHLVMTSTFALHAARL